MRGKELISLLQKNGWTLIRIKGSHHIMKKGNQIEVIPVHDKEDRDKDGEKIMIKVYSAIIHNDEDGLWISFPDIEGCNSVGNDIEDVIANGEEALGLYLATLIESGQRMPEMTRLEDVVISGSDIKTYISVDVDKYHRDMRSVKKTVSIPAWQAKAAQKQQLSLSKVLQQALNTILV